MSPPYCLSLLAGPFLCSTLSGENMFANREQEEILCLLDHPNVTTIHQVYPKEWKYYYIVLEYTGGGDLFDHIIKRVGFGLKIVSPCRILLMTVQPVTRGLHAVVPLSSMNNPRKSQQCACISPPYRDSRYSCANVCWFGKEVWPMANPPPVCRGFQAFNFQLNCMHRLELRTKNV